MTTQTLAVTAADAYEEPHLAATLTLAFSTDPITRWLYPDPLQYLSVAPELIRTFGGRAFEHGTAYYVSGYAGAALWLPPGVHIDEEAMAGVLQRSVAERDQEGVFGVLEQMGAYHPSEPHWYLPLIGVDPNQQRRGLGSVLLRHTLAICDRDNVVAYLESSNPANVSLYERHGFEVIGSIHSGDSPTIQPMVRRPQGR